MQTRRNVLFSGAAVIALPIASASCLQNLQAQWANFIDNVNAFLAKGCGLIPGFIATANSIEAIVLAFYPSISAALAAGQAAIQAVASAICDMVPSAPPAALAARLRAATPSLPIVVGNVTINGRVIPIHGYGLRYGTHLRRR